MDVRLTRQPQGESENLLDASVQSLTSIVGGALKEHRQFSIRDFWTDMERRERTGYHQATLVLGLLQTALVTCYVITVFVRPSQGIDYRFMSFVLLEILIAGLSQAVYSARGICLENSSVLMVSNLNSVGLAMRMGLLIPTGLESRLMDIIFTSSFAVLTVMHISVSFIAWGGEFNRFMMFCVSTNVEIQKLFRQYQLMLALGAFDIQFCLMTTVILLFFVKTHWWHYAVLGSLLVVNIMARAMVRLAIRQESLSRLMFAIPVYIGYAAFIVLSVFEEDVLGVHLPDNCRNTALLTTVFFVVVRLSFLAALVRCVRSFNGGMKAAFVTQKSAGEYLHSVATRYKPRFLAEA